MEARNGRRRYRSVMQRCLKLYFGASLAISRANHSAAGSPGMLIAAEIARAVG